MCILDYPSIEDYPVYEPLETTEANELIIAGNFFVDNFNLTKVTNTLAKLHQTWREGQPTPHN